jgi:hypothetical protein
VVRGADERWVNDMKVFLVATIFAAISLSSAFARGGGHGSYGTGSNPSSHSVGGYTNSHGTYVQPHQQTNPNGTQYDNYNSRGNYNPYSGQTGTRSPKW